MKQVFLLLGTIILSVRISAQPAWLPDNSNGRVKLSDVIDAHEKSKTSAMEHTRGDKSKNKEGDDYQYQRWLWYWQRHTDDDGYLASPMLTYSEWLKHRGNSAGKSTATNTSNWKFIGPDNSPGGYEGIGRCTHVEFHPTDVNTYWVCTAGGGLWKTTNDGISWTCQTDMLPVLGTSDLDVNPQNPQTMYLCTGDRDASDTRSIGVLKSTDGGATWNQTGLVYTVTQNKLTNSLVINRLDTNSLTLATSDGIYKSYNGGTTWTLKQANHFKQLVYHPTDTNILYAQRTGPTSFWRSANGGNTWTQISIPGMPTNNQRLTIAVTPADVSVVKFVAASSSSGLDGIYSSTDTGKTFTKIFSSGTNCATNLLTWDPIPSDCDGQGWYDLSIAISPINKNLVIIGGVNSWYSTNGGSSWTIATQWANIASGITVAHADKHCHIFQPTRPTMVFETNDGGIYKSSNIAGGVWTEMTNGLGITQFYRNAVAGNTTFILGGAQDNGTCLLRGNTVSFPGSGDGMECVIDYIDSNTYYVAAQNGDIDRIKIGQATTNISANIPGQPYGPWVTPYIMSPFNHLHIMAGFKNIYYSSNTGTTWDSLCITPLNSSKYVERVVMTPANDSAVYVVLENSNIVYYTYGFYPTNKPTFSSVTAPVSGSINDIKVDPKNKKRFWICFSGYNANRVYEWNNGTWTAMSTGLPSIPLGCLEVDSSDGTLYAGTDIGVYFYDTATPAQWKAFNTNMPSIEVTDMGINYTKGELVASTYGRGMWKTYKLGFIPPPDPPVDTIKNITDTSADIYWNNVSGGISYEYFISTNATPPASGTGTTGTFYHAGSLTPGTKYYVHLKTIGNPKNSVWITDNFTTTALGMSSLQPNNWGVMVYPNPVINMVTIKIPMPYTGRGMLTITDITGKLVNNIPVTDNIMQYDMSKCKSGRYIFSYSNGVYMQTLKVTKQ